MSHELIIVTMVLLLPFALYMSARIVAIAWYKTKREHTRSLLNEINPGPYGQNQGD